jgi:transketolase
MAEQNLVGIAAGLAKGGLLPVAVSYGAFLTRRAYDQIAISIGTGSRPVILVGFLPGITSRFHATHQATDDIALMTSVPGMTVIDPADATELLAAFEAALGSTTSTYIRAQRGHVAQIFSERSDVHSAVLVRDGTDYGILSSGLATLWALEAADELALQGITGSIMHVPTIRPVDESAIICFLQSFSSVVSIENHSVHGGLAASVAVVAARSGIVTRLRALGVPEGWGAYGTMEHVRRSLRLDAESIATEVIRTIKITHGRR